MKIDPRFAPRDTPTARRKTKQQIELLLANLRPRESRLEEVRSAEILKDVATLERLRGELRGEEGEEAYRALLRVQAGERKYLANSKPKFFDPSQPLPHAKREKYCQGVARGLTKKASYLAAFEGATYADYRKLEKRNPSVAARIAWLKENV